MLSFSKIVVVICISFWFLAGSAFAALVVPEDHEVIRELKTIQQSELKNHFRLLTWNVFKGKRSQSFHRDIVELSKNADVVALQEGMIDNKMPRAFEVLPFNFTMAISFQSTKTGHSTGVITGSVASAVETQFRRSPGTEMIVKTPKMILLQKLPLENGSELLIANIHGINFVSNQTYIDQIEDVLPLLQSHQGPAIFAGDFNTWNKGRKRYLLDRLTGLGFKHAEPAQDDRRILLDHVFTRGCDVGSHEVLMDIESSDHKPLMTSLSCM